MLNFILILFILIDSTHMQKILRFIHHLGIFLQLKDKIFQFLANFQGVGVQFSTLTSSQMYLGVKIYIHWKA